MVLSPEIPPLIRLGSTTSSSGVARMGDFFKQDLEHFFSPRSV
jgi:hypothetical protein